MKLPKEIFVSLENAGTDDEYLSANRKTDDLVEVGEKKTVGVYVLKKLVSVRGQTVVEQA